MVKNPVLPRSLSSSPPKSLAQMEIRALLRPAKLDETSEASDAHAGSRKRLETRSGVTSCLIE